MSSYKHLIVWKKSIDLVRAIYTVSGSFPREERFGLTAQLRRAAVSIPSNIAEGNGRNSRSEYIHFLNVARGSCFEVDTQLTICGEIGFCDQATLEPLFSLTQEIGRILNAMIQTLSLPKN